MISDMELCNQCSEEILNMGVGSFAGKAPAGEIVSVECNRCGPIFVDHLGNRVPDPVQ
ncbi:hypothetical protein [Ralstonia phage RP13]|nr:hypothetical protein [Ralstonia phage RP13]